VDAGDVTRASTPGLQVLFAAAGAAEAAGRKFLLTRPSTELSRALTDIGLGDAARLWSSEA